MVGTSQQKKQRRKGRSGITRQLVRMPKTSRPWWIIGGLAIVFAVAAFWLLGRNLRKVGVLPQSSYGIAATKPIRYFGDAAMHRDYQITAETLHQWLALGTPITMIDVRQPSGTEGFNFGHIPGAHNIPLQWFGTELMATHSYTKVVAVDGGVTAPVHFFPLPRHTPIVVMCYDGDGGEMTPAILRLLGYQAYGLTDGVSSWNPLLNVWPPPSQVTNLPLTQGAANSPHLNAPVTGNDVLGFTWASKVRNYWTNLNRTYPIGYSRPWTISPQALLAALSGRNPPQVIDLRSRSHFAQGHIAGSVNIPFADLGANLSLLSPTRQVVLVSRTLQDSAQACAVLRLLGYHAYVLQRGIVTWSSMLGTIPAPHHYPVVAGP